MARDVLISVVGAAAAAVGGFIARDKKPGNCLRRKASAQRNFLVGLTVFTELYIILFSLHLTLFYFVLFPFLLLSGKVVLFWILQASVRAVTLRWLKIKNFLFYFSTRLFVPGISISYVYTDWLNFFFHPPSSFCLESLRFKSFWRKLHEKFI